MKEKMIVWVFFMVLVGLMICLLPFALPPFIKWKMVVFVGGEAIISTVLLYMFFGGLITVGPEERIIVEVLGQFSHIAKPGLAWICPIFMKPRMRVMTWEESLNLYPDGSIVLDFKDDSATPKGARVFLRVKSPDKNYVAIGESAGQEKSGSYRVAYCVEGYKERVVELVTNLIRSTCSKIGLNEALEGEIAGFNLLDGEKIPLERKDDFFETVDGWGVEILRVIIDDFDLSDHTKEARASVQQAARRAEASVSEAKQTVNETAVALIEMFGAVTGKTYEEVQGVICGDDALKEKLFIYLQDLISRKLSLRHGALTDVRANTGNDFSDLAAVISSVLKAPLIPGSNPHHPQAPTTT